MKSRPLPLVGWKVSQALIIDIAIIHSLTKRKAPSLFLPEVQ